MQAVIMQIAHNHERFFILAWIHHVVKQVQGAIVKGFCKQVGAQVITRVSVWLALAVVDAG